MSHIPNLRQWVAGWRIVDTQTLQSASTSFTFDVDFTTNSVYRLAGIAASNGNLVQATIRLNGDAAANYNNQRVSFYDNSGALGFEGGGATGQIAAVIGPGHTGGDISTSEQVLLIVDLAQTSSGVFMRSTVFTNGSGAGDIHYMSSKWASVANPTSITINSNIDVSGIFTPPQMGSFPAGCRFDLLVMNNDTLWAT